MLESNELNAGYLSCLTCIYQCIYLGKESEMPAVRVQLVKWGNSQAVRIPKTVLEQAHMREGDELEDWIDDATA